MEEGPEEGPGSLLPQRLWREHGPANTLIGLLASRTVRGYISVTFRGTSTSLWYLSRQPQKLLSSAIAQGQQKPRVQYRCTLGGARGSYAGW